MLGELTGGSIVGAETIAVGNDTRSEVRLESEN